MGVSAFVPEDFVVPCELDGPGFRLVPLGGEHNAADHMAWSASIDHIHATPGFTEWAWPHEMSRAQNLAELEAHAADFAARTGFTCTVLAPGSTDDVIGCVYIYPAKAPGFDAEARSWVRADHAALDAVLYRTVRDWLADVWPFGTVDYAPRH